ncbi:hypothetical protein ACB092_11G245300 [Castanea dentata]
MFYHYLGCDKEFPLFDEGFTGPRLCKPCSIQYRKIDFEEFCVAAKVCISWKEWRAGNNMQGMPMSCLRWMSTSQLCLKELAFVFSSVSNGGNRLGLL